MIEVKIDTEFIKLGQFLKFIGEVQTGGEASFLVQEGFIQVNNDICRERGKKLKKGDLVEIKDGDGYIVI